MPLVPEKLNSRQEVRNAISSQFWDQPVHSGRLVDGVATTLACEPPPPGQTAASGLLRPQELLITQAAGVPAMPGYSEHSGGLVSCTPNTLKSRQHRQLQPAFALINLPRSLAS